MSREIQVRICGGPGGEIPLGYSTCATSALFYNVRVTAQEMREGPSEPACRSRLQTTSSCAGKEPGWCALRKSRGIGSWQVCIRKMSGSEPLMRCRKYIGGVKTEVHSWSSDKHRGYLSTVCAAPGIKVA